MNKVMLTGNLVADPELRKAGESNVCNFRIAVRKQYPVKEGEVNADFFTCTAWNNDATFISQYGAKGRVVAVEGYLKNRDYVDKEGQQRRTTDVVVSHLELIGRREESDSNAEAPSRANKSSSSSHKGSYTESDDELPF